MVHSLQSSQHGGRARPEDFIYPSTGFGPEWAEPNLRITLHGLNGLKRAGVQRTYVGGRNQEAIWKTFSAF